MKPITRGLVGRVREQIGNDLRSDRYLQYILLSATVLTGFWFWHQAPLFATHDAYARLTDSMLVLGAFTTEDSSIIRAIQHGRVMGSTFYLFGITLIPLVLYTLLTGQFDLFSAFYPGNRPIDRLEVWQSTPEWLWTSSIILARFLVVLIAIGCVYLTYRIGTELRDRSTGRLAAVLLSLTWGFLISAHEIGEDIPMVFVLLCVVYIALKYAKTGDETLFLAGCALGGIAIGLKLSGGISVFFLAAAFFLHGRHVGWREALVRPRLLGVGLAFGVGTLLLSFPDVLVGGIGPLVDRLHFILNNKSPSTNGTSTSIWLWMARGYLNGLGLPLTIAAVCGVIASLVQFRDRSTQTNGVVLLLVGLAAYLLVFSRFRYVRTHHLLPTFPMLGLLVAVGLVSLYERRKRLAGPLIAGLVITTGAYAVVGDLGYASQPWDEASNWLDANAADEASVEVYVATNGLHSNSGIDHGTSVYWYGYGSNYFGHGPPLNSSAEKKPTRAEWVRAMPERCPEYIQLRIKELTAAKKANGTNPSKRAEYLHELYYGDTYPYEVVKEFGSEPTYTKSRPKVDRLSDLLRVGVIPWTRTFGDSQDSKKEQYTVIMERTGRCTTATG